MWSSVKQFSDNFLKYSKVINTCFQNVNRISSVSKNATIFKEAKVNVDGVNINYVKTGKGDHPLLLLPGAMGTIWTDFKPQIEHLNKEKLTIIAWDPPGYGKSRPPNRSFPENFFKRDAHWACNFMKHLGYNQFSLLGWSDGGITSLILASEYPENICKMIVIGANAYITPEEMKLYEKIRNIDTWSERMRAPLLAIYGEKYFRDVWGNWIDAMKEIFEKQNGNICKNDLAKIRCPTLIVHGMKDVMVFKEHPDFLKNNIKDSRVKIFEAGAHNLHLKYAEEFNTLVNQFLTE